VTSCGHVEPGSHRNLTVAGSSTNFPRQPVRVWSDVKHRALFIQNHRSIWEKSKLFLSLTSRGFLYSRHADFTDNKIFRNSTGFYIPYGRFRNLIRHFAVMFLRLQIMALEGVGAYQLMILVHVEERWQNLEKRLLASSYLCLSFPSACSNWAPTGRIFLKLRI
jgi:hypothetical protein